MIADSAAGRPAILIGHSRAGPLLATAGTMLGARVRGYVFVDARLVRQQFATGCPRLPMAMLEEIHPLTPGWPTASGGYLQLSEAYAGEAAKAGELGWPVRQLLSHHLALLTEPGRVAREVRKLIGEF